MTAIEKGPWPATLGFLFAMGCGGVTDGSSLGSETHFLARCTAECGGGLECIEGVCTRACSADSECSALSAAASCAPAPGASGGASCRVECGAQSECVSQDQTWSCEASRCVKPPASLVVRSETSPERCPTFEGGVAQPVDVQTTFERVPGSSNVEWAHADADGVYWIDFDGGIYAVRRGEASAVTLRPPPSPPVSYLGLMSDVDRVYWTEAAPYPEGLIEPGPPPPPGRVMSMTKSGGAPALLVESSSQVLRPLGVDPSGRLLVTSYDGYVNQVSSSGVLERLTNVPQTDGGQQLADGLLYWTSYDDEAQQTLLFVAEPGAGVPVPVTPLPESQGIVPFVAGRGIVLWTEGETRFEPLLLVNYFVMFNQNTGCIQELPSVELSIGQTLLDDRHVYWQSFNGLEGVSPGQAFPAAPILRVNLRTGRFERVVTPGLDSLVTTDLIAQDETTLYLRQSPEEGLFAVRKPD